jgi:carbonic anhydrase
MAPANWLFASLGICASLLSGGEPAPAPVKKPATTEVRRSPATAEGADRATGKGTEKTSERPAEKSTEKMEVGGDPLWADLMAGNRRFVGGRSKERELLKTREELAGGQHPEVMVLACADSRVSPELVFDQNLGQLFVVRVAGNVAEPSAVGSLEYAAEHLHSKMLVVLGHDKCGAVAAAASGEWMPSANLHDIVKRITPALATVERCRDAAELSSRQVRANVEQAAGDVLKLSPILEKAVADGDLTVVRAVYHLKTGEVERIDDKPKLTASAKETTSAKEEPARQTAAASGH